MAFIPHRPDLDTNHLKMSEEQEGRAYVHVYYALL